MQPRRVAAPALAMLLSALPSRAEEPNAGLGVFTGAATTVVAMGAGAVIVATSAEHDAVQNQAGWFTMESGFVLAPIVAHGVVHEWTRGLWFAAIPAASVGGTAAIFAVDPEAVRHGVLSEQRVLWGIFGAALFVGSAGVVDVAFAGDRARTVSVAPMVGGGRYGVSVGGVL